MNINNLIKESHEIALSKGWYDCDECGGEGKIKTMVPIGPSEIEPCPKCNWTGKKDRDISEMIALIISELYEAMEAHRKGRFADLSMLDHVNIENEKIFSYEDAIKDTFEDECADVLIRLFDMMGYLGIEYDKDYAETVSIDLEETFFQNILLSTYMLINIDTEDYRYTEFIEYFINFCKQQNVDIETHIKLKMEYNKTREYKHGKRY